MALAFILISAVKASDPKKKLMGVACARHCSCCWEPTFMMPDLTIEHKAPGAFLMRHAHRIQPETMLVADEDPMGAVCWFYKRNDVYLLEGGGEVSYGLEYEDAKYRSLEFERNLEISSLKTPKKDRSCLSQNRGNMNDGKKTCQNRYMKTPMEKAVMYLRSIKAFSE